MGVFFQQNDCTLRYHRHND